MKSYTDLDSAYPGQYHLTKPSELKPAWLLFVYLNNLWCSVGALSISSLAFLFKYKNGEVFT